MMRTCKTMWVVPFLCGGDFKMVLIVEFSKYFWNVMKIWIPPILKMEWSKAVIHFLWLSHKYCAPHMQKWCSWGQGWPSGKSFVCVYFIGIKAECFLFTVYACMGNSWLYVEKLYVNGRLGISSANMGGVSNHQMLRRTLVPKWCGHAKSCVLFHFYMGVILKWFTLWNFLNNFEMEWKFEFPPILKMEWPKAVIHFL